MTVADRKLEVLRAIVQDYVATQEPVSSKALLERHQFPVSAATLRNDMMALEEDGYVTQPHASAGRVPTEHGYRLFVDRLAAVKPLSGAERRAIETFLQSAVDIDDVIGRTVRLLAQLTQQVALVQYPVLARSRVRHIELVSIAEHKVLVVVIVDTGQVEQRIIDCHEVVEPTALTTMTADLNRVLCGKLMKEAQNELRELSDTYSSPERSDVERLFAALHDALTENADNKVLLAGAASLTRHNADFPGNMYPILEALEEQMVLLKLIGENQSSTMPRVQIGEEKNVTRLPGTSMVTASYGNGSTPLGSLGVLGPTRMDYPATIGAVRAVARYVGTILTGS